MLSEEEKNAIDFLKECVQKDHLFEEDFTLYNIDIVLKLFKKQQEQLETIKEYTHQEIVHYTEDIRDYIHDNKEGNKHIIGELKEYREHWKDIEKILQNKPKEELYMNWWKDGLYK